MNSIVLEKMDALEYIYNSIESAKNMSVSVLHALFHHNATYEDAVSICKHGILTVADLNSFKIKEFTEQELYKLSDIDSHANGIDSVSLSIVGLDDIYPNEEEYNPFRPNFVDFLIDSDIDARRFTVHYGNEFLSHGSIKKDKIKSLDIRMLTAIENARLVDDITVADITQQYNYLKRIAIVMQEQKISFPIREMSGSSIFELSKEKLANQPVLLLK